jgi:hypothetical protein
LFRIDDIENASDIFDIESEHQNESESEYQNENEFD